MQTGTGTSAKAEQKKIAYRDRGPWVKNGVHLNTSVKILSRVCSHSHPDLTTMVDWA